MVEHDAEIMRSADRILDLGPGAGENGGRVIATGTYDEIRAQSRFPHRPLLERRAAHTDAVVAAHGHGTTRSS